jgi:hypothetical protein
MLWGRATSSLIENGDGLGMDEQRKIRYPEQIEQLTDEELLDLWEECAWRRTSPDFYTVDWCEHEMLQRYPEGDTHTDRIETIRKIWKRHI